MKVNRLEAHDRFKHFQNQWETISQGCMECIKNVPESIKSPFYVFAHPRTIEADEKLDLFLRGFDKSKIPSTRLIWGPRITKPKAQTNSYLFLANKNSDIVKVIWLLPAEETWEQYGPDKMTANEDVWNSIQNFKHAKEALEAPDPEGPTKKDERDFFFIYGHEARNKNKDKHIKLRFLEA